MSYVDLHAHVLHGIDDGSSDLEMTLRILQSMKDSGVTEVYCTPHFNLSDTNAGNFFKIRKERIEELTANEDFKKIGITVRPGAEVLYMPSMHYMYDLHGLNLGDSNFILIEIPQKLTDSIVKDLGRLVSSTGMCPIIAHAERNVRMFTKKYFQALSEYDLRFQVNIGSVIENGAFSKAASWLIENGYCDYLASDTHNVTTRVQQWDKIEKAFTDKFGKHLFEKIINQSKKIEA